jgi:hypothetical protein
MARQNQVVALRGVSIFALTLSFEPGETPLLDPESLQRKGRPLFLRIRGLPWESSHFGFLLVRFFVHVQPVETGL